MTNAGAEIYSATMPTTIGETSEASALCLAAIERAQAQVENVVKSKRHRVGMSARIRSGMPSGQWAYGYQPVRDDQGKTIGGEFGPEIEELAADPDWLLNGPPDEMRDKLRRAGIRVW